MRKWVIWFFSHWLIMGRSRNWPDLMSTVRKIRDIIIVGTYDLIISSGFQNVRSSPEALAQRQRRKKVTWRRVTSSDLATWSWKVGSHHLQTSCKIDKWIAMQNFTAIHAMVFLLFFKNLKGADIRPPSVRGLNYDSMYSHLDSLVLCSGWEIER